MSRVTSVPGKTLEVFAVLLAWASFARAASNVQTFALSDTKELVLLNVKADAVEYQGRKARDGSRVTGTWSGDLGVARPVAGTWRNGYVELTCNADWPSRGPGGAETAAATLAGWIDGDPLAPLRGRVDGIEADGDFALKVVPDRI
jgi:hypothetical protein